MSDAVKYLPANFKRLIHKLKDRKVNERLVFFVIGSLSLIWFLIRVIPKPSRASYPCMRATAPFMSAFVLYILSLVGGIVALKKSIKNFSLLQYGYAFLFLIFAGMLFLTADIFINRQAFARNTVLRSGEFTPNAPVGTAQGILPGRVVWVWNEHATNENCTNTSNGNGVIDINDDGWFMQKNNNSAVIDSMVSRALLSITGASSEAQSWDQIFRYFNMKNGNGNIGYTAGEKIFIKINATSAYGGLQGQKYYADLSRNDNLTINPFAAETNPYIVLSILRQLVHNANVPEYLIYVGDPARNIYKEHYELWRSEFPTINYLGNNLIHTELNILAIGRLPVVKTAEDKVFFSDHGTVMEEAVTDKLFTIFEDMDYLINIPTMKAHATAGITIAAKNHFGSFTRQWAMQLHPGLMENNDNPVRLGYGLYRVQTDIMMHNLLSGKNLLILVDGLYPSDDAGAVPDKWESPPFNGDWCSSIFTSLDPVAIESVCHDFLRTEYNGPTIPESRPNWYGVDDYLHQAADSSLWADGITYDPDNDGILFASLGVHEHWNDSINKQYTRNLGTGEGIELIKIHDTYTSVSEHSTLDVKVFPNPAVDYVFINNNEKAGLDYYLMNSTGKILIRGSVEKNSRKQISLSGIAAGHYILTLYDNKGSSSVKLLISE